LGYQITARGGWIAIADFHSLILCGDTMDRLLAQGLRLAAEWLCRSPATRPCTHCPACRKVLAGQHVDVTVINEGADAVIKVAAVRDVRRGLLTRPFDAERNAVLIAYAENLNPSAQNALLTLLEEPPLYSRLVLLCRNIGALLPTVRSRCVTQRLPPEPEPEPPPELMEAAERYVSALPSGWDRAALAVSWEKYSRGEMLSLLGALLLVLRQRIERGERAAYHLQKADTVLTCADALRQNASPGSVCGVLMAIDN